MICPHCKKEIENDSIFCPICGEKIDEIDLTPQEEVKEEVVTKEKNGYLVIWGNVFEHPT